MSDLAEKECIPCKGGVPPLKGTDLKTYLDQLDGWTAVEEHHLRKEYAFPNFVTALAFVNRVGELAERQGHHPDLYLSWGKATVEMYTHKINGLTESDFILAAKIDKIRESP